MCYRDEFLNYDFNDTKSGLIEHNEIFFGFLVKIDDIRKEILLEVKNKEMIFWSEENNSL